MNKTILVMMNGKQYQVQVEGPRIPRVEVYKRLGQLVPVSK